MMVQIGVMDRACTILENARRSDDKARADDVVALLTATVGLLRNVSAQDDVKTSLCCGEGSVVVPAMLWAAQHFPKEALLQEHVCGTLAAMALRRPKNALHILELGGANVVLGTMRLFPNHVVLCRQACLAVRNLTSRLESSQVKLEILQQAEPVLLKVPSGCADEAYAALRDLGCTSVSRASMRGGVGGGPTEKLEMFGRVQSSFRPVYD
mmetsp:Transcript_33474/g.77150  ORF Transcript_33474/g.77150 Transcript_33474/m.77150 type:complete len:211 (-) Transcript_33474:965-1597(-)